MDYEKQVLADIKSAVSDNDAVKVYREIVCVVCEKIAEDTGNTLGETKKSVYELIHKGWAVLAQDQSTGGFWIKPITPPELSTRH